MWQKALEDREQQGYRLGRREKLVIEWRVKYLDTTRQPALKDTCGEKALVLQVTESKCIGIKNLCFGWVSWLGG